jgi:hypothetical protein
VGGATRAVLNAVAKRKIPGSRRETNSDRPDCPARILVTILTELSVPVYCQQCPPKDQKVSAEANFDVAIGFIRHGVTLCFPKH